ncbi:MAG TPA: hypothetical protein VKY73_00635 [Polyangiaceae bacterium]|nr:hypothetical protein [Polyangiaceae bacterium]
MRRALPGAGLVFALASGAPACRDEVPLGAWESPSISASGGAAAGEAGARTGGASPSVAGEGGGGAGTEAALPECLELGAEPSAQSRLEDRVGATEMATDWTWPSSVASMEWELMVEREIERALPNVPEAGYYWTHQFSFEGGVGGYLGIQAEGGYQEVPPGSEIFFTKMAVFWLSGPPLDAELGDIAYPDARIAPISAAGVSYLTIHARFEWQACHVYRFRIAPESTASTGVWYGAWIEDVTDGVETFLGRMLLPADTGLLAPFSISRTQPINRWEPSACGQRQPGSAVFGTPRSVEDGVTPIFHTNRFVAPLRCTISQFTEFPGGVRHELGLPP